MTGSSTVLGFDFGTRRIGVALGERLTATARPLTTLTSTNRQPDWAAIGQLIAEWQPERLVVGLPIDDNTDRDSDVVTAARRFARRLNGRYRLPVDLVDERLSSWAAEQAIAESSHLSRRRRQDKATIDQVAAALILETWFQQPQD